MGTLAPVPAARATLMASNERSPSGLRCEVGVLPVPVERGFQPLAQRNARLIAESCEFRNVGAAARGAARLQRRGDKLDAASGMGGDALRQVGDRDLFGRADMINAE